MRASLWGFLPDLQASIADAKKQNIEAIPEGATMINSMKPEVAAKVVTEFFNDLYVAPN
jgi:hypothetical protein